MQNKNFIEKIDVNDNLKGIYEILLCPLSNTIKFSVTSENSLYCYVVGDFNNWQKSDEYRLTWQVDTRTGILKMIKEITFPFGLTSGIYKYKYIIVDINGNEKWIDNNRSNNNSFSFTWNNITDNFKIYSSNNVVSYNYPVELVGVCTGLYGNIYFPEITWHLGENIDGVTIKNGFLTVDKDVKQGTEIILMGETIDKKLVNSKKIIVEKNKFCGTLVHFYLDDKKLQGNNYIWNCWLFGSNCTGKEEDFNINTDFGFALYSKEKNLIVRKKLWSDGYVDFWSEQTNTYELTKNYKNIYILHGDTHRYTSLKEALIASNVNIKFAVMDNSKTIKLYLSKEPLLGVSFDLYINNKKILDTSTIINGKEAIITNLPQSIKANDLLVVSMSKLYRPCKVLMRDFLNKFYYSKSDLGVTYNSSLISFKLWAPTCYKAKLVLYDNWYVNKEEDNNNYEMVYDYKSGVYSLLLNRELAYNKYYLYKLYFKEIDGNGEIINKVTYVVDPYSHSVGINGDKGFILDLNDRITKPDNWENHTNPYLNKKDDSILYELHIRDFTIDKTSGVTESLRGTYLGAIEENTKYKKVKTGLDHLIELGVTHVQLMPVFDFGSVDEKYTSSNNRNWGYDPKNFNVPEGSYSTNPYDPISRIVEFRKMIMKFHEKGIRVVMDMVYNHMMDTLNMENIVPSYYFRTDYVGRYTNGSGCGNEIATERPMIRKFIIDSCLHWIRNYRIDGIRFDLMELIDLDTIKKIVNKSSKIDKNFLIYGEPWKGGNSVLTNGTCRYSQKNEGFSIFNDIFRDAIRGNNTPSIGFINGDQHNPLCSWSVLEGLKGSIYTLTSNANESINYIDAHDNYTLWDQIEKSQNPTLRIGEYRKNLLNNKLNDINVKKAILGLGILLTAQGIPFLHCGSEFLRSKQGEHNSYKSNDYINSIKWSDKEEFIDIFNYVKGLIEIRNKLSFFNIENSEIIKSKINITFANNDEKSGVIINHINLTEYAKGEALIIYNGTNIDDYDVNSYVPIPKSKFWNIIANESYADLNMINTVKYNEIPKVKSFSIMILCSI